MECCCLIQSPSYFTHGFIPNFLIWLFSDLLQAIPGSMILHLLVLLLTITLSLSLALLKQSFLHPQLRLICNRHATHGLWQMKWHVLCSQCLIRISSFCLLKGSGPWPRRQEGDDSANSRDPFSYILGVIT